MLSALTIKKGVSKSYIVNEILDTHIMSNNTDVLVFTELQALHRDNMCRDRQIEVIATLIDTFVLESFSHTPEMPDEKREAALGIAYSRPNRWRKTVRDLIVPGDATLTTTTYESVMKAADESEQD